jgi:hypothetical protein
MATVVSVMDRDGWDARTDNIVVADPERRLLLWVPRDLWCESLRNRINTAFARGGHDGLLSGLEDLGLDARHSLCVRREAIELALADVAVTVPVMEAVDFWYPLSPTEPIEEGRKLVRFDPPAETLSGERIHQWLGARLRPDRASSDLERIERQQVFVRTLLDDGFDFGRVLARSQLVSASSEAAVQELEQVTSEWSFETLGPVAPETIDGMMVLVLRKSRLPWRG